MSGDILNYHNLVWVDATGIYFVIYTAKHSVMHRTAPDNRNHPAPNAGSAEAEKPWGRQNTMCAVPPVVIEHTSEESKLATVGRDTGEHPCELQ